MKSAVKVLTCDQNDELWDEYFLLLMRRYEDLGLPYPFDMTFSFIGNPIVSGNALIVQTEDSGDTIGAIGFVFGTGEDQYTDDSVCQVEALYIEPRWRRKVTAMMLLEFIACLYQGQHQVER